MTTLIDDRNPSVSYKGSWSLAGSSLEYDDTTTFTKAKGATVSLTFLGEFLHFFSAVDH